MGENYDDVPEENSERGRRVRDIWTARIVGCVAGALIPLVLTLIPIINKYIDNHKEIALLGIQNDVRYLKDRIMQLESDLDKCKIAIYEKPKKISFQNYYRVIG